MKKDIPFFENTADNTHCFQASLKMVLKYFLPEKDYSFEELDKITAKKVNLWTWPLAGTIWMQNNGFKIKNIEYFDYNKFIENGGQYIIDEYGREVGEAQIENSDIEEARLLSKEFLKVVDTEIRIPQKEDIIHLMEDGYIVTINLNSNALAGRNGYAGHSVVITGFDDTGFIFHNPGIPGKEYQRVPFNLFEKAWAYPNQNAKNILAFKLNN